MSSRASQWPCPQPPTTAATRWRLVQSTTAYGHRRRTGPGRLRTKLVGDRSPKQPGSVVFFELFDEDTAGLRPEVLAEPRPQERVQWHVFSSFCWFDAPRAMFPRLPAVCSMLQLLSSCTWKSVHYFCEPSVFSAFFRSHNFALVDFLGPSSSHSCECSRAGGARSRREFTPR